MTPANQVYQFSLVNALMVGVAEQGTTASALTQQGNQGLGTFSLMRGELVMLDGMVYQLLSDGSVCEAEPDQTIPFAMVTHFEAQITLPNVDLANKQALDALFEKAVPGQNNLFVSYRIEGGSFPLVHARAICGQEYHGQPLEELHKTQKLFTLENVQGTVVGFRSPPSWQGFSVAGQHLHFLSSQRTSGGHILDLKAKGVTVHIAVASKVQVDLPTSDEFNRAKLDTSTEGIQRVEG